MTTSCWGVVVAAGRGERFGGDRPKALIDLAGTPLLVHAFRALHEGGCVGVVVAVPAELVAEVTESLTSEVVPSRVADGDRGLGAGRLCEVLVVAGGATRQASVTAATLAVPDGTDFVLVHDAARPLMPASVVAAVRTALEAGGQAVVPVLPVIDTIKAVDGSGVITATVDRSGLWRAQTPQGFDRELLIRALDASTHAGQEFTDDAAAAASLGVPVVTVPGDERGLKITSPADLSTAAALLLTDLDREGTG